MKILMEVFQVPVSFLLVFQVSFRFMHKGAANPPYIKYIT